MGMGLRRWSSLLKLLNETSVRGPERGFWLTALLLGAALVPGPAAALTPIDSADLSPDITVTLDGQTITDENVASDDLTTGTITKALLGILPEASDLSAYHVLTGGDHLLSFDITVALAGGVTAHPGDIVRYDGASYTLEFDASAESVPDGVRTDAVTMSAGGNLVLSFDTTVALGGSTYFDEDLVEFDGANFSSFFDGSAAGLDSALDIDAAHGDGVRTHAVGNRLRRCVEFERVDRTVVANDIARMRDDASGQRDGDVERKQVLSSRQRMVGGEIACFGNNAKQGLRDRSAHEVVGSHVLIGDRLAVEGDGDVGREIRAADRSQTGRRPGQEGGREKRGHQRDLLA